MPKYKYTALALDGSSVTGVVEEATPTGAGLVLLDRDLEVTHLVEKKGLLQFEITRKRVPRKELMQFSRQLSVFLRAGIPVLDALEMIEEETTNKLFKKVLVDIIEQIRGGDTFAGAAKAHPEAFPQMYLGVLEVAEVTGHLDRVLRQLADYIERDLAARRKVSSALMYPAVVAVMAVITVVVLTGFVLPRFKTFFASLNAKLPLPTRMLMSVSHIVSAGWPFFVGFLGLVVVALWLGARTQKGRDIRDRVLLSIPVIGDLVKHAILERFARVLSSMVRAGVQLPAALLITADGTSNSVYKHALLDAREAMIEGEGLAQPIAATGLFPSAARQMLRVGEETGTLGEQLETTAEYFEQELDFRITRFTNLFEPAVIIFMGVVVGFVAIALVSAMYGIFRQVKV
jgi:type IV pilus assembly protein PilC